MGKITRQLDEIDKLIIKAHQTPAEKLKEIEEELQTRNTKKGFTNLQYFTIKDGITKEAEQPEEETTKKLIEAREILKKQLEQEQEREELNKIKLEEKLQKQEKKEIQALLFDNINNYFLKYPNKRGEIWHYLHDDEVIQDEIREIVKIYGAEYTSYLYMIYNKTINQVFKLYSYNIKQQQRERENAKKQLKNMLKRSIAKDIAIIGILKMANKKGGRR